LRIPLVLHHTFEATRTAIVIVFTPRLAVLVNSSTLTIACVAAEFDRLTLTVPDGVHGYALVARDAAGLLVGGVAPVVAVLILAAALRPCD